MEDSDEEKKFTIAVTLETMTEQISVPGMKKANNVSQVEQTIPFGTEGFIKTQKEMENVKTEITHNFYFY